MNDKLKSHPVAVALALVLSAATDNKAATGEAGTAKGKLIAAVRNAATVAHAEGWNATRTADALAAMGKVQEVPEGTLKPYRTALKGYVVALEDGETITTGYGTNGDKPMPAPVASEFAQYTAEERAARAALKALRSRITAAAKRMTDADALAELAEMAETLAPAEAAKPVEQAPDLEALFSEAA